MDIQNTIDQATDTFRDIARRSRSRVREVLGIGPDDDEAALRAVMGRFDTAMLLTNLHDVPCGRPMRIAAFDDVGMWFVTDAQSPKVYEIRHDQSAIVTLQGRDAYAVVRGHAELQHDPARLEALWSPMLDAWFPEPSHAVLVCFVPHSGQYWDLRGTKGIRFLGEVATALARGEPVRHVEGTDGSAILA